MILSNAVNRGKVFWWTKSLKAWLTSAVKQWCTRLFCKDTGSQISGFSLRCSSMSDSSTWRNSYISASRHFCFCGDWDILISDLLYWARRESNCFKGLDRVWSKWLLDLQKQDMPEHNLKKHFVLLPLAKMENSITRNTSELKQSILTEWSFSVQCSDFCTISWIVESCRQYYRLPAFLPVA